MFKLCWIVDNIEVDLDAYACMGTAMMDAQSEYKEIGTFALRWDGWGDRYMVGIRENGKIDWRSTDSLKQKVA